MTLEPPVGHSNARMESYQCDNGLSKMFSNDSDLETICNVGMERSAECSDIVLCSFPSEFLVGSQALKL